MGTIFHGNQPYSGGGVLNIVHKTWEQYRALSYAEKHDTSKYYFVPDAPVQGVPGVVADLQDEVDTLNSKLPKLISTGTGDGVKTYGQLLNEMFASITPNANSMYILSNNNGAEIYTSVVVQSNQIRLSYCYTAATGTNYNASATLSASSSMVNVYFSGGGNTKTVSNATTSVVASGVTLKLYEMENIFA
jgi:hypothetical protein